MAGRDHTKSTARSTTATWPRAVYYRVTVTTGATLPGYFGLSSYDFGAERIFFGKRSGSTNFGFEIVGGASSNSTVPSPCQHHLHPRRPARLRRRRLALFLNPDFNLPMPIRQTSQLPASPCAYTGTNWSTAVRLASGGGGDPVTWDDLVVATSWDDLGTVVTTAADEDNGNLDRQHLPARGGEIFPRRQPHHLRPRPFRANHHAHPCRWRHGNPRRPHHRRQRPARRAHDAAGTTRTRHF